MQIGIIGSGDVGQALGRGLVKHGHTVTIGSRSPQSDDLKKWRKDVGDGARTGTFAEAAAFGELVILATNGQGTLNAIALAEPANFDGKLVLDATNPLVFDGDGPPVLFVGTTDSLGEQVQRSLPEAKVVKCFNTVGNVQMIDPQFDEGPAPMLIAGDDPAAKKRVDAFLRELGWPGALDVGDLVGARWLEALVPLWVRVGGSLGTWGHMFKATK